MATGWTRSACATAVLALALGGCTKSADPEPRFVEDSDGLPTTGEWRQRVAILDLDADGRPEIVAPPARREAKPRPHVWERGEDGRWTERKVAFPERAYAYGDVVAADFDGDRRTDLAFAMHGIGVVVLLAREDGSWVVSNRGLPADGQFPSRAIAAGDVDGDGWVDLVSMAEMTSHSGRGNPGLRVHRNLEGAGWRTAEIEGADAVFGDRLVAARWPGAEGTALFVGSLVAGFGDVAWRRAAGEWQAFPDGLPNDVIFWDLSVCDVDGDGSPELFVAIDAPRARKISGPRMFRHVDGRWVDRSAGLPSTPTRAIAAADLGDGCALAVTDVFGGDVTLYRTRPGGESWDRWTALERPAGVGGNPYGIVLADADGDGTRDVVVNYGADPSTGAIRVWRQESAGGRRIVGGRRGTEVALGGPSSGNREASTWGGAR